MIKKMLFLYCYAITKEQQDLLLSAMKEGKIVYAGSIKISNDLSSDLIPCFVIPIDNNTELLRSSSMIYDKNKNKQLYDEFSKNSIRSVEDTLSHGKTYDNFFLAKISLIDLKKLLIKIFQEITSDVTFFYDSKLLRITLLSRSHHLNLQANVVFISSKLPDKITTIYSNDFQIKKVQPKDGSIYFEYYNLSNQEIAAEKFFLLDTELESLIRNYLNLLYISQPDEKTFHFLHGIKSIIPDGEKNKVELLSWNDVSQDLHNVRTSYKDRRAKTEIMSNIIFMKLQSLQLSPEKELLTKKEEYQRRLKEKSRDSVYELLAVEKKYEIESQKKKYENKLTELTKQYQNELLQKEKKIVYFQEEHKELIEQNNLLLSLKEESQKLIENYKIILCSQEIELQKGTEYKQQQEFEKEELQKNMLRQKEKLTNQFHAQLQEKKEEYLKKEKEYEDQIDKEKETLNKEFQGVISIWKSENEKLKDQKTELNKNYNELKKNYDANQALLSGFNQEKEQKTVFSKNVFAYFFLGLVIGILSTGVVFWAMKSYGVETDASDNLPPQQIYNSTDLCQAMSP